MNKITIKMVKPTLRINQNEFQHSPTPKPLPDPKSTAFSYMKSRLAPKNFFFKKKVQFPKQRKKKKSQFKEENRLIYSKERNKKIQFDHLLLLSYLLLELACLLPDHLHQILNQTYLRS